MQGSAEYKKFNPQAVHPSFPTEGFYPPPPADGNGGGEQVLRIVDCRYHMRNDLPATSLELVGVVGIVLSYTTPQTTAQVATKLARDPTQASTGPNKRVKTFAPTSGTRMIMFGDAFSSTNQTFCIVLAHKSSLLQHCKFSSLAAELSVGDVVMIHEPSFCTKTLGSSIPILEGFRCIVPLRRDVYVIPKQVTMSSEANQQIHFVEHNCQVQLSRARFLWGGEAVPCVGNTCDRQSTKCKGCNGVSPQRRNFVLCVTVEVLNRPDYDAVSGRAVFELRSYRFTNLVIKDIETFSRMPYENMENYTYPVRAAVLSVQDYVNNHGGWTVIGWHRRGVIRTGIDDALELSTETKGHLVRLEPTNTGRDMMDNVSALRFEMQQHAMMP